MARVVKRLTRAEQQERTRLGLIDAAIDLFIDKGIDATSIEEICAAAGFTRGAFYSNFETKDDLYLAAFRGFLDQIHAAAAPPPEGSPQDPGNAYGKRLGRLRNVRRDRASVFLAEASLYAIRRPTLVTAVAEMHREQLAPAIAFVEATAGHAGIDVDSPDSERLANVMQCLTFAAHLFGMIDPRIEPEETLTFASDLMFRGLSAPKVKPKRGARGGGG